MRTRWTARVAQFVRPTTAPYPRNYTGGKMNNPKSPDILEQKVIRLRDAVRQEKLKKADELLAHRLVYSTIIFIILFLILGVLIVDASSGVQWLCLIPFFGAALLVLGRISVHYSREKKEAENELQIEP